MTMKYIVVFIIITSVGCITKPIKNRDLDSTWYMGAFGIYTRNSVSFYMTHMYGDGLNQDTMYIHFGDSGKIISTDNKGKTIIISK